MRIPGNIRSQAFLILFAAGLFVLPSAPRDGASAQQVPNIGAATRATDVPKQQRKTRDTLERSHKSQEQLKQSEEESQELLKLREEVHKAEEERKAGGKSSSD